MLVEPAVTGFVKVNLLSFAPPLATNVYTNWLAHCEGVVTGTFHVTAVSSAPSKYITFAMVDTVNFTGVVALLVQLLSE